MCVGWKKKKPAQKHVWKYLKIKEEKKVLLSRGPDSQIYLINSSDGPISEAKASLLCFPRSAEFFQAKRMTTL